ncbi:DNA-directed RNA polymerase III subunit RPC6 [Rhodotorula toruloides]|uniref:DNA-directed RNA polymerase III subunit RPC6 n=1 Tax=Rhodotorula toruloides TaxID=5286 RepID=A0A511KCP2_RHOTO|nr:DNA-directed RNA polymerase III subunit RPC6 [Rhodotorula toruloides]
MPPKASTSAAGGARAAAGGNTKKLSPLELKLLNVGLSVRGGEISQQDLFAQCGLSVNQASGDAVNSLLRKGLAQMLRTPSGQILFRFMGKEEAKAMSSMDSEEKLVLDHIKEAGNMGIWSRTLNAKTGLPRATVEKALKVLEGRKTIKRVKSVKAPTRKIYMLAGIQPSVELTGGPWFTDNELDTELVEQLKKISIPPSIQIHAPSADPSSSQPQKFRPIYPTTATPFLPSVEDVLSFITGIGATVVDLHPEHVEALLDLMIYDGVVEKVLVQRNPTIPSAREREGKKGKVNGKGKGKASASSKRKKGAASSGEDSSGSDGDGGSPAKGRKGKTPIRQANGKAKRKRAKYDLDAGSAAESSVTEDEGDAAAKRKRKKKQKPASDDEDDDAPRRKKRGKPKVKRSSSDSEAEDSDDERDGNASSASEEDDGKAARRSGGQPDADDDTHFVYRLVRPYAPVIGWTDMPCGRCPVEEFCSEPPRLRAESYRRPTQTAANPANAHKLASAVAAPAHAGRPTMRIELEGGIQGVGMLGGAGAAIGVSDAKWGELKGGVDHGVAPVNPVDCPYFKTYLDF